MNTQLEMHHEVRYIYEMVCDNEHPSYQCYYGSKSNCALAPLVDKAIRIRKVADAAKLKGAPPQPVLKKG